MIADWSDSDSESEEETEVIDEIGAVPTVASVQRRINDRYDRLFIEDKDGKRSPYVCTICDEVLTHEGDINWIAIDQLKNKRKYLQWSTYLKDDERHPELEQQYTFNNDPHNRIRDKSWLSDVALSPRGTIGRLGQGRKMPHGNAKWSFSCCSACKSALNSSTTPFYSIVNRNFFGCPPDCLKELTWVELALITPVQCWGYCFTYIGGKHMNLKGTLSFMRVKERSIARAATHLETMGISQHVVVLLTGPMTAKQHEKAKRVSEHIRTDKILTAVKWLIANHVKWKNIDLDEFRAELENVAPAVIDTSHIVQSENTNIEKTELFTCYMPDSSVSESAGGFDSTEAFKNYVEQMAKDGFEVSVNLDLSKKYLNDQDGDHIVNSCLLQFPYGVGGYSDRRVTDKGSFTTNCDHEGFYRHISKLSQPVMQQSLFQLVMYHQVSKLRLLRSSYLQVRGKKTAEQLASGITYDDVRQTARARSRGDYGTGTTASKKLLSSIDGMGRALPHTDDAAKKARSDSEAMQHEFGGGSIFLTVTFDDNNTLLLQVLSEEEIDDETPIKDLSDEECAKRVERRTLLRAEYPGMSSIHFEMLLNILIEEVVGWDTKKNEPTRKAGLFGECIALAFAIEEQGRKTLHIHMTIWIKFFRLLQKLMFFGQTSEIRQKAMSQLGVYYDRIATTKLFDDEGKGRSQWSAAFDHDCQVEDKYERQAPAVTSRQQLRNLRHILGYEYEDGVVARCPHCEKTWKYEGLLNEFVRHTDDLNDVIPNSLTVQDQAKVNAEIPKARMQAMIVEFQKQLDCPVHEIPSRLINANSQHHISSHTRSCFDCKGKKKKRGHVHDGRCECRYRLPDMSRNDNVISAVNLKGKEHKWYNVSGKEEKQPIVEFLPRRGKYDLFQNVSCKAISESKFACNSNVQVISDGPIAQYCFKYNFKPTNKEETSAYSRVENSIKKMDGVRKHDDNRKEALRVLARAAFAHNKKNVIGAPMANYLTRIPSRFFFSHKSVSVPVKDLIRVENMQGVTTTARFNADGALYFENNALHYLCRHPDLDTLSAKEFYTLYEVCNIRRSKKRKNGSADGEDEGDGKYSFFNTEWFKHPSVYLLKTGARKGQAKPATRGVQAREEPLLAKVSQWMFPDSKKFGAIIFTCTENDMNEAMENYSQIVLTMLLPHRRAADLKSAVNDAEYPYTLKLQEVYRHDSELPDALKTVFTERNMDFLQNIQNARHNSLRYKVKSDALQSVTEPFKPEGEECAEVDDDMTDAEEEEPEVPANYEDILAQQFDGPSDLSDKDPQLLPQMMQKLSFSTLRDKGTQGCGYYEDVLPPSVTTPSDSADFVYRANNQQSTSVPPSAEPLKERLKHSKKDVVQVLLKRTTPVSRPQIFKDENVKVSAANGTIGSLREWAAGAELDLKQTRAFESITAAFLLTFFDLQEMDSSDNAQLTPHELLRFQRTKANLIRLKGTTRITEEENCQLVCLMHGPGGSGKTTVIELVTFYCQDYCKHIGHPYTQRTIVITAMSGVAATLIHGETAHGAMGINRSKVTAEEKEQWSDTRLVIIDEISMASADELVIIHNNLTQLSSGSNFQPFGGLNIVFVGDYSQLEPVRKAPVYIDGGEVPEFHGELNCYIELEGHHRFKDDPAWGRRCQRFRDGVPTLEDVELINEKCVVNEKRNPPAGIQIATYTNKNRDALNSQVFEEFCIENGPSDGSLFMGAVIILMDDLLMVDACGKYVRVESNSTKKWFWQNCSEDDCDAKDTHGVQPGRIDPMLKLYHGCPLMLVQNKDVPKGQANGSRVFLEAINLMPAEEPFNCTLECGTTVRVFTAKQIKSLIVKQENKKIIPSSFDILPTKACKFRAAMNLDGEKLFTNMKGTQFPLVSNSATTGHKLQGYTAVELLVNEWRYAQNWAYVMLSRVREMAGLYIRNPLTKNLAKFAMDANMLAMIKDFRQRLLIDDIEEATYADMVNAEEPLN